MNFNAETEEMVSNPAFKERLEVCIKKCGSVYALAKLSGLSKGAIRRYQNGSEPSRDNLVYLAAAAGVTPYWLSFGFDPVESNIGTSPAAQIPQTVIAPARQRNPGKWVSIDALETILPSNGGNSAFRRGSAVIMVRADLTPQAFMGADPKKLVAFRMPDSVMKNSIEKNVWGIVHLDKMPGAGLYCLLRGSEITARYVSNDGNGNIRISCDDERTEPSRSYSVSELGQAITVIGEVIVVGIWPK
jgi:transcriptional regulator with XRE-family HTH domain